MQTVLAPGSSSTDGTLKAWCAVHITGVVGHVALPAAIVLAMRVSSAFDSGQYHSVAESDCSVSIAATGRFGSDAAPVAIALPVPVGSAVMAGSNRNGQRCGSAAAAGRAKSAATTRTAEPRAYLLFTHAE